MIYTAKFSHTVDAKGNSSDAYIIAGGSNPVSNEVRIFLTQTKRVFNSCFCFIYMK